jgi:murein DD-endopeptidase MepM/ murein hydrolase activator NlpD
MTVPARMRLALAALAIVVAAVTRAELGPAGVGATLAMGHDDNYVYRLPYGDAVSFSVLQGYGSALSHRGPEFYTVDFGMPEGTLVYSAREGTVLAIEDRFDISCWADDCGRYANFVEILHPDGTIGRYFHLQRGSVLVEPGQRVARGEAVARSGDTGYATVPHLHFGVYRFSAAGEAQSIAVRFAVRGGLIGRPRVGARYINAADRSNP